MAHDNINPNTEEDYRTLVLGRDVTDTIDFRDYTKGIPEDNQRRREKHRLAREWGEYPGATVDIMPNGSVTMRYWDKRFNVVSTASASNMYVGHCDFDVMLAGFLAGGARILDHRLP